MKEQPRDQVSPSRLRASFEHVVLTRFNVRMSETSPPLPNSWLVSRLSLFEHYTLAAVRSQVRHPDLWLVFCDDRSPGWFRTELEAMLTEPHFEAVWLSEVFGGDISAREVAERASGRKFLITTRIDNDDLVARDFISGIQECFDEQRCQFINFTHGAQTEKGRMYLRSDPSNAFVSLIERRGPGRPMTVFVDAHNRLGKYAEIVQMRTHPMWIQVIHGANVANAVHGIRTQPDNVLQYFDVQPPMEHSSRFVLETDKALSALRLALRVLSRPHRIRWAWRVILSDARARSRLALLFVVRLASHLVVRSRPARRRMALRVRPRNFKETYINEALAVTEGVTYVEIGVRDGDSMREVKAARRIGVDPARSARLVTLGNVDFFEKTSDAFFSEDAPALFAATGIDVALIDGLHEFRQALRDLLNLERHMNPGGVIVLDDLNPLMERFSSDRPTGGHWNGDVWKIAAFLHGERPDLFLRTVAADQGIGIVTGFTGRRPEWPSSDTIKRYKALRYDYLSEQRRSLLNLVSPAPLSSLLAGENVIELPK